MIGDGDFVEIVPRRELDRDAPWTREDWTTSGIFGILRYIARSPAKTVVLVDGEGLRFQIFPRVNGAIARRDAAFLDMWTQLLESETFTHIRAKTGKGQILVVLISKAKAPYEGDDVVECFPSFVRARATHTGVETIGLYICEKFVRRVRVEGTARLATNNLVRTASHDLRRIDDLVLQACIAHVHPSKASYVLSANHTAYFPRVVKSQAQQELWAHPDMRLLAPAIVFATSSMPNLNFTFVLTRRHINAAWSIIDCSKRWSLRWTFIYLNSVDRAKTKDDFEGPNAQTVGLLKDSAARGDPTQRVAPDSITEDLHAVEEVLEDSQTRGACQALRRKLFVPGRALAILDHLDAAVPTHTNPATPVAVASSDSEASSVSEAEAHDRPLSTDRDLVSHDHDATVPTRAEPPLLSDPEMSSASKTEVQTEARKYRRGRRGRKDAVELPEAQAPVPQNTVELSVRVERRDGDILIRRSEDPGKLLGKAIENMFFRFLLDKKSSDAATLRMILASTCTPLLLFAHANKKHIVEKEDFDRPLSHFVTTLGRRLTFELELGKTYVFFQDICMLLSVELFYRFGSSLEEIRGDLEDILALSDFHISDFPNDRVTFSVADMEDFKGPSHDAALARRIVSTYGDVYEYCRLTALTNLQKSLLQLSCRVTPVKIQFVGPQESGLDKDAILKFLTKSHNTIHKTIRDINVSLYFVRRADSLFTGFLHFWQHIANVIKGELGVDASKGWQMLSSSSTWMTVHSSNGGIFSDIVADGHGGRPVIAEIWEPVLRKGEILLPTKITSPSVDRFKLLAANIFAGVVDEEHTSPPPITFDSAIDFIFPCVNSASPGHEHAFTVKVGVHLEERGKVGVPHS